MYTLSRQGTQLLSPFRPYDRVRRGIVGYWPLARLGVVDLKAFLRPPLGLTNVNTVTRAAGPSTILPDAAHMVAASTQQLTTASTTALIPKGPWTRCVWVKLGSTGADKGVFSLYNPTGNQRSYRLYYNNALSRLLLGVSDDGTTTGGHFLETPWTATISTGTWYFIACGQDANKRPWISQNGGDKNYGTALAGFPFASSAAFQIGTGVTDSQYWDGDITVIDADDRDLTMGEIIWLYNNGAGRNLLRAV